MDILIVEEVIALNKAQPVRQIKNIGLGNKLKSRILSNRHFFLLALALALFIPSSYAASCGTTPSGLSISYCIPISIKNTQSTALTNNTQIMLNFNASNYTSYLASNLQNIVIYNTSTGKTSPAWIEGNLTNESNKNNLNKATDIVIWLKFPEALAASSTDTNWAIGVGSTSTNYYATSGADIGIAPQLTSTYGEYDNGKQVFNEYSNFTGTSTPSGWTTSGTVTINDGLSISGSTAGQIWTTTDYSLTNNVMDFYGTFSTATSSGRNGAGFIYPSSSSTIATAWNQQDISIDGTSPIAYNGGGATYGSAITAGTYVYSVYNPSSSTASFWYSYSNKQTITADIYSTSISIGFADYTAGQPSFSVQWVRARVSPPNGVQPTFTSGAISTPGTTPSVSISPSTTQTLDDGQSVSFTSSVSGGTTPYTYQWYSGTSSTCTSNSAISGATSSTYSASPTSTTYYCLAVTSASLLTGYSSTTEIVVNSALSAGSVTPSNPTIKIGGSQTLTANPSGGTTPYSYQWYGGSSSTCTSDSVISGATSSTYSASPTTNTYYCYKVTDSATTPTSQYSATDLVTVTNYTVDSVTWNTTAYETSTQGYTYSITLSPHYTTANVEILIYNSTNLMTNIWNNQTVSSTQPQSFVFDYNIPLLEKNNTVFTIKANLSYGKVSQGTINTITQNEIENYYPVATPSLSKIIQGDNQTIYLNITQKKTLNKATVASDVQIGNQTITEHVTSQYKYYAFLYSFINSNYSISMPTINSPVSIPVNVPVTLSYDSENVIRNVSTSFESYLPAVVSCTTGSTNTINWNFYNATTPGSLWPTNVLFKGYFQVINNLYTGNVINGTDAGLTSTATSNKYATCIYPSFASFDVNGGFSYRATNASLANYYLQGLKISNQSQNIDLYLEQLVSPVQYEIATENVTEGVYIASLVNELLYNPNTNTSVLVDEFYTQAGSGTYTYLELNSSYKFMAYTPTYPNKLLAITNYLTAFSCGSAACPYVIQVGNFSVTLVNSILKNFQSNCIVSNYSTNKDQVSCTFTSLNGTSYNTSLLVTNSSYSFTNKTTCYKSVVTKSGSLNCVAGNVNATFYDYFFKVNLGSKYGWYTLQSGTFGSKSQSFGQDGIFLALLIIVALPLLFITKNPTLSILAIDIGFTLMGLIGLIGIGTATLGFMWVASIFLMYIINRR